MSEQRKRESRRRQRRTRQQFNAAPPGQTAGRYSPLTEPDMQAIFNCASRILSDIGMAEAPPVLLQQALDSGATLNDQGRLCFPESLTSDILANACHRFVWPGRNSRHDIEIGGQRVWYGTGGAAVQTLDLHTHRYRPSTLQDLYDFTRLIDSLENVSWFTRCCIATDIEDSFTLDINTVMALLCHTEKPVGTAFTLSTHVEPIMSLLERALPAGVSFRDRPFCKAHISPVISPLRYGEDAVDVALACMRHGIPVNNIVAAQSGATAPATLAGMLASTLAETLAALIMINLFEPGYPMIFSNWPLVIDLRTGSFSGGGGEIALLNAASAQLGNWLGLPSGAACSMSDAKAIDTQMGMEKALTSLAVGLSGCNMIYESAGMTASLLGASFEAFVLDNEMLSNVQRVLRGIEVNDETLAFDSIRETVGGDGHFLGSPQTLDVMETEYHYPGALFDRDSPSAWQQAGAEDAWQRANQTAIEILDKYQPRYLDSKTIAWAKHRFPIAESATLSVN